MLFAQLSNRLNRKGNAQHEQKKLVHDSKNWYRVEEDG